jgi:CHAT domain-containing protein/tetratricopeptide (TPR) repeat protein
MVRASLKRIAAYILIIAVLAAAATSVAAAQSADDVAAFNKQVELLYGQGKYVQAAALAQQALSLAQRVLGKEHPDTLRCLNILAFVYDAQGRYAEAEPLYRRALEARQRILGPEHEDTLLSMNNLALLYYSQGRYAEAEPLLRRVVEGLEHVLGKAHPNTLKSLNNLAEIYDSQGRYSEAEPLLKRALAAEERELGAEHRQTLESLNNLAGLYWSQGRYAEAEPLLKRALAAFEHALGTEHPQTLTCLNNLAMLYQSQGRYAKAEPLLKRALAVFERALGAEHPKTLTSLNNLANFYFEQRDWPRAAGFWRRSTAGIASRVKRDAQETAQAVVGKKKSEAEQLSWQFSDLVKAVYRLSPEGAMPDANAAREMFETAQWAQSSEAAASLVQMAARGAAGDPKLAALVRERQNLVAEWQKREGLSNAWLGEAKEKRDAKAEAEDNARLAAIDTRIAEIDQELTVRFPDYTALVSPVPLGVEDVQALLAPDEALVFFLDTKDIKPTPPETFIWVVTKTDMRWVHSDFGTLALALAVQVLRCGLDDAAWADENCSPFVTLNYTDADQAAGKPLPFDLAFSHKLYRGLFGQVEDLIKGKQLLIVPSGALAQLPFQTLVTALPTDAASNQTPREVAGLDGLAKNLTRAERQVLKLPEGRGIRILRLFSGGTAPAAYLKQDDIVLSFEGEDFGDSRKLAEAMWTHAPGSKVQFRVLRGGAEITVTETLGRTMLHVPRLLAPGKDKNVAWLIRDHALTVLPAVSSIKALRRVARHSAARKPMIGFGNPLLNGRQNDPQFGEIFKELAQRAREKERCPETAWQRVASLTGLRRGVAPVQTRGGLADVNFLRMQTPLPETADELCAVARDIGADMRQIRLGASATEREVKRLSETGQLAQYRILHFATHGALAGQVRGNAEPGLLLTPPVEPSEEDDGYLTASEIAALKLDANWVILSACNTAAGGAEGAEALSGLARAFIYAQARALLVSHWEVDSAATVKLITGAMKRLAADKGMGRAEAMRQSMLALIDAGGLEAHPAFWAPFVVAGEGGAAR